MSTLIIWHIIFPKYKLLHIETSQLICIINQSICSGFLLKGIFRQSLFFLFLFILSSLSVFYIFQVKKVVCLMNATAGKLISIPMKNWLFIFPNILCWTSWAFCKDSIILLHIYSSCQVQHYFCTENFTMERPSTEYTIKTYQFHHKMNKKHN